MSNKGRAESKTNSEPNSVKEVEVDCSIIWGAAHQFAYMRLSEEWEPGSSEVDLLDSYQVRAKRIAATYARMYLETEDGFDPAKKGRFYWMALGAFASKTVACLQDKVVIDNLSGALGNVLDAYAGLTIGATLPIIPSQLHIENIMDDIVVVQEALGVGNLWLFMDVAVWHWAYANHPNNYFKGMNCEPERDISKLPKEGVYETVNEYLQWSSYASKKISLKSTSYIKEGMQLVDQIEKETNNEKKEKLQMKHLKAVANHEQLAILQPLIYDHKNFRDWLELERKFKQWIRDLKSYLNDLSWYAKINLAYGVLEFYLAGIDLLLPKYELVFSASCSTKDSKLISKAPQDMKIEVPGTLADAEQESPKTRMGWIGQAAAQFHDLMRDETQYMEGELHKIAQWYNEEDEFFGDPQKESIYFQ